MFFDQELIAYHVLLLLLLLLLLMMDCGWGHKHKT